MRALFYDCRCGISGDMNLGALIDVGVPQEYLAGELAKLKLDDEFRLEVSPGEKLGITGTRAKVDLLKAESHGHHDHHHHHHHRTYRDIRKIIDAAPFGARVLQLTHAMFEHVARAEAKIHGQSVDDVHFHEVGAVDSVVDIFGAAIALDYLKVETVLCTVVEVGGGFVKCEHGTLPVPAPATAEILQGVPCRYGTVEGETTTPTGAAILKATVDHYEPTGRFTAERIGYGVGHRDFPIPNVVRVMLGDYEEASSRAVLPEADDYEISTNIDDMSAEAFEPLIERLFESGASDVFLTPIIMKKSRLGQMVTVLCTASVREPLLDILMENSSTIGVRMQPIYKHMLPRTQHTVSTTFGEVQVKVVELASGKRRWKVEHDDIARIARERETSYQELRESIEAEVSEKLRED